MTVYVLMTESNEGLDLFQWTGGVFSTAARAEAAARRAEARDRRTACTVLEVEIDEECEPEDAGP